MAQLKVQDVACELILNNPEMSNIQLASLVRQKLPACKCGNASIAWYKNKLKSGEIESFIASDGRKDHSSSYLKKGPSEGNLGKKRYLAVAGSSWPDFGQLKNEEMLQLAKLTTSHICFLNPEIVRHVVEDNERRREEWSSRLGEKGVDPSLYLWQNSSCAFPGVRRYAGSKEIAIHRRQKTADTRPEKALALDDNTYPKQIWSFVFQGRKFANLGPQGYALAHLVDHKDYKNRVSDEFDNSNLDMSASTLFGLYTCPTNTVYIPSGLMRPTDFSFSLRNLIQRRAEALYGSFCNLVPPNLSLRAGSSDEWSLNGFDWREPVGRSDHIQSFLSYRKDIMEKLFDSTKG